MLVDWWILTECMPLSCLSVPTECRANPIKQQQLARVYSTMPCLADAVCMQCEQCHA